jgi:hypothetical protein
LAEVAQETKKKLLQARNLYTLESELKLGNRVEDVEQCHSKYTESHGYGVVQGN